MVPTDDYIGIAWQSAALRSSGFVGDAT